jgi:tRNA-dihydrouridine synthase B
MLPKFKSKAFLAPMAGYTDPAFRLLCNELEAGLTITELTSIHSIIAKKNEIKKFVGYSNKEKPRSVQIFGNDIKLSVKASKILEKHFDIIDINLGCPSPNITQQMAGAALLQKPEHMKKMFKEIVKNVSIPVTVKMRAGVNDSSCFLNIGKIAEESGIKMLTLHARTVKQGYSGKADWNLIKELKENVSIPVVGNGDINFPEDAFRMFKKTKCDYVMVGRASMGNPFIFKQINDYLENGKYKEISLKEKIKYFRKYLDYSKDFNIKFSDIKIHAMQYTKGIEGGAKLRLELSKVKDIQRIKELLHSI